MIGNKRSRSRSRNGSICLFWMAALILHLTSCRGPVPDPQAGVREAGLLVAQEVDLIFAIGLDIPDEILDQADTIIRQGSISDRGQVEPMDPVGKNHHASCH